MTETVFWTVYTTAVVVGLSLTAFYNSKIQEVRRSNEGLRSAIEMAATMSGELLVHTILISSPKQEIVLCRGDCLEIKIPRPGALVCNGTVDITL